MITVQVSPPPIFCELSKSITKITKAAEKLEAEMGRPPKVEEISHQLDVKTAPSKGLFFLGPTYSENFAIDSLELDIFNRLKS